MAKKKIEDVKIEVNAPKTEQDATVHDKVTLVIDIPFTDKHTGKDYKINDEIAFEKERAEELLRDQRNLVHKK